MDWIFIFLPMCLFYSLYISASTLSWVQSTFNNSWKKYILRLNIKYILKRLNLKHILDVYILMWPQVSSICPLSSNEDLEWCFPASGGTTLYVCELWRPGSCYGLRPTLIQMSADIKSWKIFLIWQSSRNSNVDIVLFCSKYGDSWQRFLLEVNNNTHNPHLWVVITEAWRTCWMWSPRPPAASSSSTKSPLTIGCSNCTTNSPPVYLFSHLSWLLPSEYHLSYCQVQVKIL